MQPVMKHDPAPSRWSYRLQRLMLTPAFHKTLRVGVPVLLCALAILVWFSDKERRASIVQWGTDLRSSIEQRPEFMVRLMTVDGASPEIATAVREALSLDLPVSSFHLDLENLRDQVAKLDAVESASLRVLSGGTLQVTVHERVPALVWRSPEGLILLDGDGHRVAPVQARTDRPDLPVVAGEGADAKVSEALSLIAAATPLRDRVRGLERIGGRRWDLVLDRDQRIMLPAERPVRALERVIALEEATDLLARDLVAVDLRLEERPVLRMTTQAAEDLRRSRTNEFGVQSQ